MITFQKRILLSDSRTLLLISAQSSYGANKITASVKKIADSVLKSFLYNFIIHVAQYNHLPNTF